MKVEETIEEETKEVEKTKDTIRLFLPAEKKNVPFIVWGDSGSGTKMQEKVAGAMGEFSRSGMCPIKPIGIHLGDICYGKTDIEKYFYKVYEKNNAGESESIFQRVLGAVGNHEYVEGDVFTNTKTTLVRHLRGFVYNTSKIDQQAKDNFLQHLEQVNSARGSEDGNLEILNNGYYKAEIFTEINRTGDFEHKITFFFIDASVFVTDPEQQNWLRKNLNTSNAHWNVLVSHWPVQPQGKHGQAKNVTEYGVPKKNEFGSENYGVCLASQLTKVLQQVSDKNEENEKKIHMVLSGHEHFMSLMQAELGDCKVTQIISGAGGGALQRILKPGMGSESLAEKNGFVVMRIMDDNLVFEFRDESNCKLSCFACRLDAQNEPQLGAVLQPNLQALYSVVRKMIKQHFVDAEYKKEIPNIDAIQEIYHILWEYNDEYPCIAEEIQTLLKEDILKLVGRKKLFNSDELEKLKIVERENANSKETETVCWLSREEHFEVSKQLIQEQTATKISWKLPAKGIL